GEAADGHGNSALVPSGGAATEGPAAWFGIERCPGKMLEIAGACCTVPGEIRPVAGCAREQIEPVTASTGPDRRIGSAVEVICEVGGHLRWSRGLVVRGVCGESVHGYGYVANVPICGQDGLATIDAGIAFLHLDRPIRSPEMYPSARLC